MAGQMVTTRHVFKMLVANAVAETRFDDASYLHYLLASQCLDTADRATGKARTMSLEKYASNEHLSRLYYAYEVVHRCVHEPFSLSQPETLLNAARYALALLEDWTKEPYQTPPGVSMFCIYLCLAKQAKVIHAFSIVRQMLYKIVAYQVPQYFQSQEGVELLIVKTRASGGCFEAKARDDDMAALCWRCRRHVPPLAALRCPHCRHPIAYSFATHEVLPLVQFEPEAGISLEEALELIERTPLPASPLGDTATTDHDAEAHDPFLDKVYEEDESGVVVCSRGALLRLSPASVVVVHRQFYRNMVPELPVCACPRCQNVFYLEDFEIQLVTYGRCPFCRQQAEAPATDDADDFPLNDFFSIPASPKSHQQILGVALNSQNIRLFVYNRN